MKNLLSILVCMFIVSTMIFSCSSSNTASDYAAAYYKAMQKGDYAKVLELINCENDKEATEMAAKLEQFGPMMVIKDYAIESEELSVTGDTAIVHVKLTVENNITEKGKIQTDDQKLKIIKVNGKWGRIDM
ncbi:hypothetical protein LJC11_03915 [Bacteroidales bacterium OttesenSCG-928-I21]|nr:hypothetical protein [Bacteroidales bacterium OttesenSCG-928-I21]